MSLGRPGDSINLPFEPSTGSADLADGTFAAGVVVIAGVLPAPGLEPLPVLVFRFTKPDGTGFYPPIALVIDDADMGRLPELVTAAAEGAIAAARKARAA